MHCISEQDNAAQYLQSETRIHRYGLAEGIVIPTQNRRIIDEVVDGLIGALKKHE